MRHTKEYSCKFFFCLFVWVSFSLLHIKRKEVIQYTTFPPVICPYYICWAPICHFWDPSYLHLWISVHHPNSCLLLPWIWMCSTPVQPLYNNCRKQTWPDVHPITLCQLYYTLSGISWKIYYSIIYDKTQLTPCSQWHPAKKKKKKNINEQCSTNTYSATYMVPSGTQAPCPQSTLTNQGKVWCKDKKLIHCFKQTTGTIYSKQGGWPNLPFVTIYITCTTCRLACQSHRPNRKSVFKYPV